MQSYQKCGISPTSSRNFYLIINCLNHATNLIQDRYIDKQHDLNNFNYLYPINNSKMAKSQDAKKTAKKEAVLSPKEKKAAKKEKKNKKSYD